MYLYYISQGGSYSSYFICDLERWRRQNDFFCQSIPASLKQEVAAAVDAVTNWQELHTALGALGLTCSKFGPGARIGIIGSTEFAKASAFGAKFSIGKMITALGPYQEPEAVYVNQRKADHIEMTSITGLPSPEDERFTRAVAFKVTLLRRTYTGVYLDPAVAEAIKFVDLADTPPQITFKDGATVVDHGRKLSTSQSTRETRATMIAMIKAKGWSSVGLTGSPAFIRAMALDCANVGIAVRNLPPDVQVLADEALAQARASQSQLERAAHAAQEAHLQDQAVREAAVVANVDARALPLWPRTSPQRPRRYKTPLARAQTLSPRPSANLREMIETESLGTCPIAAKPPRTKKSFFLLIF